MQYICKVNKAQQLKKRSMKNLITYFTPRNTEERNSLFGIFAGLLILSIVFYFYSL
jgi:hypothetical protein